MNRSGRASVAKKLREILAGEVFTDDKTINKFSRDQSIYEIKPLAVVSPADLPDVQKLIQFAAGEGLTVTPRGGGSGTAGSALGHGIIVALPQKGVFNQISRFSVTGDTSSVCVGAGVYHQRLQDYLRPRHYFLPADVSSAGISQIGGNIATKASGPHALKHGSINQFLEHIEFVTARGERVDTSDETTIPEDLKDRLNEFALKLLADEASRAFLAAREGMKIASGYNLFAFLRGYAAGTLVTQLFAGSIGSLGLITGARIQGKRLSHERAAMVLYFDDLVEAGRAVTLLLTMDVAAIEIISKETVAIIKARSKQGLDFGGDAHVLLLEFEGKEQVEQLAHIKDKLYSGGFRFSREPETASTETRIDELWTFRKQILPLIQHPGPHLKALSVVNDVGVDPRHIADFIKDLETVFKKHHLETVIYGHAGSGNLHLRPLFDLRAPDLKGRIRRLADDVYDAVFKYQGTISGEHGMGRLRAPYLSREWGEKLYGYMKELKAIFDPQGIFNPDVMFSEHSITDDMRKDYLTA